jgi:hypothetical protein
MVCEAREAIARAIHQGYQENQVARKPPADVAMAPWEELPGHLQESCRRQADHILEKLRQIGCTVDEGPESATFTDAEIELMAQLEHKRWLAERRLDGWQPGPRDVLAKTSPYFVSWAELPEEAREWDREAVRLIPEVLSQVGLAIRRQVP